MHQKKDKNSLPFLEGIKKKVCTFLIGKEPCAYSLETGSNDFAEQEKHETAFIFIIISISD